jgi:hypothetical protein
MPLAPRTAEHACPFIDEDDPRCAKQFTLGRLGHAFGFCFGVYAGCSIHAQLLEQRRYEAVAIGLPAGIEPGLQAAAAAS